MAAGESMQVGHFDLQWLFQIQAPQIIVSDVAIVFKTIGLSLSFHRVDRDEGVGLRQQLNSSDATASINKSTTT